MNKSDLSSSLTFEVLSNTSSVCCGGIALNVLFYWVAIVDYRVVVESSSTIGFLRKNELIEDRSEITPRTPKSVA